ncbi:MAG: glycerol-3-phosphate 1-O-acyltransferase PlsY [Planctomycetota bacterium]|nr:glycerol-3-phosphate 1-O-acyltransferase PlsY [Planctomycetota bacterium]
MSLGSPWSEIVLVIGAFFLGGVPFGWIFARLVKGVDLRRVGSGGTGATNCSRLWHGPTSLLVFMLIFGLDFGKGLLGALISEDIARLLAGGLGADPNVMTLQAACGLAAILGHIFSPFLGFRGGKGVATTFGVVIGLAPISVLWGLGAWGLLVALTRYMSLGSMGAMVAIAISHWLMYGENAFTDRLAITVFLVASAAAVIWQHRTNIQRILAGTERRVGEADQKL